jgi:hypothetical protein
MYAGFRSADVIASRVSRAREVLAVSTVGYSEALAPPVQTSVPQLFVVNSAQIVNGTLNINETIALAERQLPELQRRLGVAPGAAAERVGVP